MSGNYYTSHLSMSEIKNRLNSELRTGFMLPHNKIVSVTTKKGEINLKSILCFTKVKIESKEDLSHLELKTRFHWPVYFIPVFLIAFFSGFLFSGKVTINGNPDPGLIEKLGVFAFGLVVLLVFIALIVNLKSGFIKYLEEKIDLKMKRTDRLQKLIVLLLCFLIASCANPFGVGTWRPLPFKCMQEG